MDAMFQKVNHRASRSPTPTHFPLKDHEVAAASVEDIVEACKIAPNITKVGTSIKRISENAIVKFSKYICLSEARNMQLVANRTSIRLPRVIRAFEVPIDEESKTSYIVMEYIRGEILEDVWDNISEERRQNVCDQVVNAIAQLEAIELDRPGPVGGGTSRGPWFTVIGAGPFDTIGELEDWFTHKLEVCKKFRRAYPEAPSFSGKFGKLVMSHMDISARNIILEKGDQVCLIDWDFAGAYPVFFERAALATEVQSPAFCERILSSIDPYEQEVEELKGVSWALTSAYLVQLDS